MSRPRTPSIHHASPLEFGGRGKGPLTFMNLLQLPPSVLVEVAALRLTQHMPNPLQFYLTAQHRLSSRDKRTCPLQIDSKFVSTWYAEGAIGVCSFVAACAVIPSDASVITDTFDVTSRVGAFSVVGRFIVIKTVRS